MCQVKECLRLGRALTTDPVQATEQAQLRAPDTSLNRPTICRHGDYHHWQVRKAEHKVTPRLSCQLLQRKDL